MDHNTKLYQKHALADDAVCNEMTSLVENQHKQY